MKSRTARLLVVGAAVAGASLGVLPGVASAAPVTAVVTADPCGDGDPDSFSYLVDAVFTRCDGWWV
jgi:hypothetical protein